MFYWDICIKIGPGSSLWRSTFRARYKVMILDVDVLQRMKTHHRGELTTRDSWAGHCRDVVIFTFMLRCWMFGALWVGLSPASLYSHISTQHRGMGEHNSTNSTATARNSKPIAPDQADSANIFKDVIQTNSRIPASHTYVLLTLYCDGSTSSYGMINSSNFITVLN